MDPPGFPQHSGAKPHPSLQRARLQPLSFPPGHGVHDGRGFSTVGVPVGVPAVGDVASIPVFHAHGLNSSFQSPSAADPMSAHGGFGDLSPAHAVGPGLQHRHLHLHLQPQPQPQPLHLRQTYERRDRSPPAPSSTEVVPLPPPSQVSRLPGGSTGSRVLAARVPRTESADLARTTAAVKGPASLEPTRGGQQPSADVVEEPPDLGRWRQKLFDLEEPVVLTLEE